MSLAKRTAGKKTVRPALAPAASPLELANSNPSAPPTHFRTPHTMHPVTNDYGKASRITWYTSNAFWALAAVETVIAGGIGLYTRHWMGPDFLWCFAIVWLSAFVVSWFIRSAWRDEWLVRILALLLFEFTAIARVLTSDHPGLKRYEYLITFCVVGGILFLVRIDDDYDEYGRRRWSRRSSWDSWWFSGCNSGRGESSSGSGGSSSGGGGGCGG